MKIKLSHLLITTLFCGFVMSALAAPSGAVALRVLSYGPVLQKWTYQVISDGKIVSSGDFPDIPNRTRSKPVRIKAGQEIQIFDGPIPPPPAPESTTPPAPPTANAKMLADANNILLVVFPISGPEEPKRRFVAVTANDDMASFPIGSYQFFNVTAHEIAGLIGGKEFSVSGGKTALVTPPAQAGVINLSLFDARDKNRRLMQRAWIYSPLARVLVFIRETSGSKPMITVQSMEESESNIQALPDEGVKIGPIDIQSVSDTGNPR